MEAELRYFEGNFGFTLLFVGLFILLTVTRVMYPRRFAEFVELPITDKYFALEGKHYEVNHPFNLLLFVVQWLSYSTFIFLFVTHMDPTSKHHPYLFLQITAGFLVFVSFRYYFEKLLAYVLNIEGIAENFLYEKLSYTNLIAMLVLVINLLAIYSFDVGIAYFHWTLGIIASLYIISLISSIKRNNQIIFKNFFYFILYLCALEFAPYIILYKVYT